MPDLPRHITLDLIRKRSEHNQNLISNLEEVALHQEELESIGPILPRACGSSLKILLLQNNVIQRLHPKELKYFKVLEYLNLALNCITVVEGLGHLEFLSKLDLTLNFISIEFLESSLACLGQLRSLKELFLLGNPCLDVKKGGWEKKKGRMYVVAKLPVLEYLDGEEITRSERIRARQMISLLEEELVGLVATYREGMEQVKVKEQEQIVGGPEDEEMTKHCPEDRIRLSRELAQQKADKEEKEQANQPKFKGEKEIQLEQSDTIGEARKREETGDFKQCNEGRWEFHFDEEKRPGYLTLDISIQKHLSSSLIDVDVHPTYISVVIKSKVLRLKLPEEVRSEESYAQRSSTTGHLMVVMPKVKIERLRDIIDCSTPQECDSKEKTSREKTRGNTSLQHEMLHEAQTTLTGPVTLKGLVKEKDGGVKQHEDGACASKLDMVECSTRSRRTCNSNNTKQLSADRDDDDDSEEPPPLL